MKQESISFWDHLEELRWRVLKTLLVITLCSIVSFLFWEQILASLLMYSKEFSASYKIIYTAPADPVILSFKIALYSGCLLASPFIWYQFWQFVAPALYKNEKRVLCFLSISSTLLFLIGALFSYLTLPLILQFLSSYAADVIKPFYRVQEYLFFLIRISLAFGILFEMPLLSFIFTKAGFLTADMLIRYCRYSFVIIFIIAAVITPPDIISQLVMALPLVGLYGISILISKLSAIQ